MKSQFKTATGVFALICLGVPLYALSPQQDSAHQMPAQNMDLSQLQAGEHVFTGRVATDKGRMVLVDESVLAGQEGRTRYHIENEDQAMAFVGKDVVTTGTLDQTTNTLHITSIKLAPAPADR